MSTRTIPGSRPAWRLTAAFLAAACILAFSALPAAAADKIEIRPQVREGLAIGFDMTIGTAMTMAANGNQQQIDMAVRMTGSVTYQKVANGQPNAADVSIGKESTITRTQNGQKNNIPFPLAGKSVTLSRGEGVQVTVNGADNADASMVEGLKKLLTIDTTMYPPGPVAVGDEWAVDPAKMPPEMTMNGQAKTELKCKLLKIGEIRGRKSYDIAISGTMKAQPQPGATLTATFGGVSQIDVATGIPAQADMVMKMSSKDAQGQGVDMQLQTSAVYTFPAEAGAPPIGVLPPPGLVPPENPLDPRPRENPLAPARPPVAESPFTGSFKGEALAGDFKVEGNNVTGTITLSNKQYPVSGTVRDGKLSGTFEAAGAKFNFVATIEGDAMTLESDGTKYAMKKQVAAPANPLGRPRNPLDQ